MTCFSTGKNISYDAFENLVLHTLKQKHVKQNKTPIKQKHIRGNQCPFMNKDNLKQGRFQGGDQGDWSPLKLNI